MDNNPNWDNPNCPICHKPIVEDGYDWHRAERPYRYHSDCVDTPIQQTIPIAALREVIAELEYREQSAAKNMAMAKEWGQVIEENTDFATMAAFSQAVKMLRALLDQEADHEA